MFSKQDFWLQSLPDLYICPYWKWGQLIGPKQPENPKEEVILRTNWCWISHWILSLMLTAGATMTTIPGIRSSNTRRHSPVITWSAIKPFCTLRVLKSSFNILVNQTEKLFNCREYWQAHINYLFPGKHTCKFSLFPPHRGMFSILSWWLLHKKLLSTISISDKHKGHKTQTTLADC